MKFLPVVTMFAIAGAPLCLAGETKVKMESLPPAVQAAVKQQSAGATIKGLTKETEKGKIIYEAELTVNGHGKDISFDSAGKVVSIEEEVAIDSIPAAARDAINKAVGTGKLTRVEQVTENGKTSYEAAIKRGIKTSEFTVDASGNKIKN
jgi:uncharacterized membrane protein YkoI